MKQLIEQIKAAIAGVSASQKPNGALSDTELEHLGRIVWASEKEVIALLEAGATLPDVRSALNQALHYCARARL